MSGLWPQAGRHADEVRVGYIDYLNSLPVYYGLETGAVPRPDGVALVKAAPTTLNRMLDKGELDVSPVSSIEYARNADDLVLLPGLSINSTGFVHSVCLFYRNGVDSLAGGVVSVTPESATSVILLRILLEKRWKLDARVSIAGGDPEDVIDGKAQGALLIGDSALKGALAYPALGRIDLGEEWTRWTGTPMVFAVWCARRAWAEAHPDLLHRTHEWLVAGKAWGRAHRGEIVEVARKRTFLSRDLMARYFRDLNYDLDAPKLAGLRHYFEMAHELGEISRVPTPMPLALEVRA